MISLDGLLKELKEHKFPYSIGDTLWIIDKNYDVKPVIITHISPWGSYSITTAFTPKYIDYECVFQFNEKCGEWVICRGCMDPYNIFDSEEKANKACIEHLLHQIEKLESILKQK